MMGKDKNMKCPEKVMQAIENLAATISEASRMAVWPESTPQERQYVREFVPDMETVLIDQMVVFLDGDDSGRVLEENGLEELGLRVMLRKQELKE